MQEVMSQLLKAETMEALLRHQGYADLQRLHRWLSYELSAPVLLVAWYVLPVLLVLKIAALAVTPFILRTLYRVQRTGWIVALLLIGGVSTVLLLVPAENVLVGYVLGSLPLVMFYLYCWALRHSIGEWLEEVRFEEQYAFLA